MRINGVMVTGAVVAFVAGMSLTTGTAAGAEEKKCSTPVLTSVPVHLTDPGLWSYTYRVTWCVEEGTITDITHVVTHEEYSSTCVWVANMEESDKDVPDGNGAREAFNMAELSCKNAAGTQGSVNPWGAILVRPDGTSDVLRKGIGDVIQA
jgi:hypothetical protein